MERFVYFHHVECKGKNVGKKNETTDNQQALFEAYSMWLKKQDQNYTIVNESEKPANVPPTNILPMLANKFTERKKYLKKPFAVSPKLDGVRVIARLVNDKLVFNITSWKRICIYE